MKLIIDLEVYIVVVWCDSDKIPFLRVVLTCTGVPKNICAV